MHPDDSGEFSYAQEHTQPHSQQHPPAPPAGTPAPSELADFGVPDGSLTDHTVSAMQLRAQPFHDNPNGAELFADEQTFAQINEIRQALIAEDWLLVLTGAAGSGKSLLLKQLTQQSGQRLQFFSVRGGENYTTHNLFNGMLNSWNLQPQADLEDAVRELVLSLQANQDRSLIVVILIDDADLIPAKEITLLISSSEYINSGEEVLLRLVLSSKPEFESQIPNLLPEGSDLPYSSLGIEPFHASRAAPYIEFRLNQAGFYEHFPLDARQVNTIANDAAGRPAEINRLTATMLNSLYSPYKSSASKSQFGGAFLGQKIAKIGLGIVALALIVAGLLYKPPSEAPPGYSVVETKPVDTSRGANSAIDNSTTSDPVTSSTVSDTISTSASKEGKIRMLGEQATSNQNNASITPQAKTAEQTASLPADTGATSSNSAGLNTTASSVQTAQQQSSSEPVAKAADDKTPTDPQSTDVQTTGEETTSTVTSLASAAPATPETQSEKTTDNATTQKTATDSNSAIPATDEPSKTAEDKAPSSGSPSQNGDTVNGIESANWVLLQDPKLYTVQMSASTDYKSVASFLRRGKLSTPNSIFSFQRGGKTWFALVHGLYPSIKDARAEIETMSKAAKSNQPWIREIGRIQQSLKSQ